MPKEIFELGHAHLAAFYLANDCALALTLTRVLYIFLFHLLRSLCVFTMVTRGVYKSIVPWAIDFILIVTRHAALQRGVSIGSSLGQFDPGRTLARNIVIRCISFFFNLVRMSPWIFPRVRKQRNSFFFFFFYSGAQNEIFYELDEKISSVHFKDENFMSYPLRFLPRIPANSLIQHIHEVEIRIVQMQRKFSIF